MIVPPTPINFRDALPTTDYINPPTSAARLELLAGLYQFLHACATTPYVAAAHSIKYQTSPTSSVLVAQRYNLGTERFRVRLSKSAWLGSYALTPQEPFDATVYGATSGSTAADQIKVASPFDHGQYNYPPQAFSVRAFDGSNNDNPTPSAAGDRLAEATKQLYPQTETFEVGACSGFSVIPLLAKDLQ